MDGNIRLLLQRASNFNYIARAIKTINGVAQDPEDIPQPPAPPLSVIIGTVNNDEISLDISCDYSSVTNAKWNFVYHDTAPQDVTITIGGA
jgi:hypothetical protein